MLLRPFFRAGLCSLKQRKIQATTGNARKCSFSYGFTCLIEISVAVWGTRPGCAPRQQCLRRRCRQHGWFCRTEVHSAGRQRQQKFWEHGQKGIWQEDQSWDADDLRHQGSGSGGLLNTCLKCLWLTAGQKDPEVRWCAQHGLVRGSESPALMLFMPLLGNKDMLFFQCSFPLKLLFCFCFSHQTFNREQTQPGRFYKDQHSHLNTAKKILRNLDSFLTDCPFHRCKWKSNI